VSVRRVPAEQLAQFAVQVLVASGVRADDAELVADSLVSADLWGHSSHGILRLPWYVARLRTGVMRAAVDPAVARDGGAVVVLDGGAGFGQVIAAHAARLAIARAREHGVAAVAVRNSNHFGTAAYFTRMAPPAGCVAVLATNASPAMAPWGGARKRVGTNPWSVAAPAGRHGVAVMDVANTVAARGKVHVALQCGKPIPPGWAVTATGEPTTDPAQALQGMMLPLGGHKGFAIAFMLDVLTGVLSGGASGSAVAGPYQDERPGRVSHLYIALHVAAFVSESVFAAHMERLMDDVRSGGAAGEIVIPGEFEERHARRAREEGVRLTAGTVADLERMAQDTGVALQI
jgi:LDH2 family malate/lactate/ureidoglycolate dehydrogenase